MRLENNGRVTVVQFVRVTTVWAEIASDRLSPGRLGPLPTGEALKLFLLKPLGGVRDPGELRVCLSPIAIQECLFASYPLPHFLIHQCPISL